MYHDLPRTARFWSFLFAVDKDLAEKTRADACRCGGSRCDVEDATGAAGVDIDSTVRRPLDREALADRQLATGQADGLAGQTGLEVDRIAATSLGDGRPERARSAVGGAGDCPGTEHDSTFKRLQSGR